MSSEVLPRSRIAAKSLFQRSRAASRRGAAVAQGANGTGLSADDAARLLASRAPRSTFGRKARTLLAPAAPDSPRRVEPGAGGGGTARRQSGGGRKSSPGSLGAKASPSRPPPSAASGAWSCRLAPRAASPAAPALPPDRQTPRQTPAEGPQAHRAHLVPVNTIFVTLAPGRAVKHFTAYEPGARWTFVGITGSAPAALEAGSVDKIMADMPFEVTASRSTTTTSSCRLRHACPDKSLDRFVLPPKRPQLNTVERCNGSSRYEFYAAHNMPHHIDKLQPFVDAFAHRYNHHRPRRPQRTNPSRVSKNLPPRTSPAFP